MHVLDLGKADWRFRGTAEQVRQPARIPGCVHLDLLRNERIPDPFWGQDELALQWIEESGTGTNERASRCRPSGSARRDWRMTSSVPQDEVLPSALTRSRGGPARPVVQGRGA